MEGAMTRLGTVVFLAVLSVSRGATADDAWDQATYTDDNLSGSNTLLHGTVQTHDLQSHTNPDEDYFKVPVRAHQSYEARMFGSTVIFQPPPPTCSAGVCARLERVDTNGFPLQQSQKVEGDFATTAVRWTPAADAVEFLRVTGPDVANTYDQYTITFLNTTLFASRFNNSATQATVLLLQNVTTVKATGEIDFWSPTGALLHGEPFSIHAHGVLVVNTATLPGVSGVSGALSVSHDAGYAGLTGKAVAVEPATGFTFETAMMPIPR
jgi:hypothetical protein